MNQSLSLPGVWGGESPGDFPGGFASYFYWNIPWASL